ncbi:MAG TPA: sigma 54-interacting transcriptional regulator [Blastocatellia bacterium]|nr:sigma 54-interacting transcriptional regulator [Blastocatellia bacterium]
MSIKELDEPTRSTLDPIIIHCSREMQKVVDDLKKCAKQDATVLIEGETGTGKEVIAREIHNRSSRCGKPMEVFSCPRGGNLIEDELFGHERGAFTDARELKQGKIERANGGTFFLDDIDDMPLQTQGKLLRVLETGEVERLGGKSTVKVDVRVIAATKVNLQKLVDEGKFRADLFYRLNVLEIVLPTLRHRPDDIPLLARHFIGDRAFTIEPDVVKAMKAYHWPGNVRELKNAITRAVGRAKGNILEREDLIPSSENRFRTNSGREPCPLRTPPRLEDLIRFVNEFNARVGDSAPDDLSDCVRAAALTAFGLPFRDARSIARYIRKGLKSEPRGKQAFKALNPASLAWLLDIREGRRPEAGSHKSPSILGPFLSDGDAPPPQSGERPPLSARDVSILLPRTGQHLFGREKALQFLNRAWEEANTHIIVLVGFGGVGKSTLLTHWLQSMSTANYRGAHRVYARSFYHQNTYERTLSADGFIAEALNWFSDSDATKARYPGERGERLAHVLKAQRALLVLDGLEVVQFPPGSQEGKLRDEGLRVLLRELAASSPGLCVISTRVRVADLQDFEDSTAPTVQTLELDNLSSKAGAQLLMALGVRGSDDKLEQVSLCFGGHPLALALLGTYLRKACHGDARRASELSLLEVDAKQGAHAIRVMESYAKWLGEGPEQAVLRMIGLFDRPADGASIAKLRALPAIPGLTDASEQLSEGDWELTISNLRDAALLADSLLDQTTVLEAHPLVREYFGSQFRELYPEGWKEGHRRLFEHLRTKARQYPETIPEMGPLFAAVAHGCKAGLHEQVLDEIYRSRLMRGDGRYATSKLAAFGPLLSALSHFFEHGDWTRPVHNLSKNARIYVLNQAGFHLSVTKGFPAREARLAYELARREAEESGSTPDRFLALRGLWRCHHVAAEYEDAWIVASSLIKCSKETRQPLHVAEANFAMGATAFYLGRFNEAREHLEIAIATYGAKEPHSGMGGFDVRVASLSYAAWTMWYLGYPDTASSRCEEALARARTLLDHHTLALALHFSAGLAQCSGDGKAVQGYANELLEISSKYGFVHWLACGTVIQGCASVMHGLFAEGIERIRSGLGLWEAASAKLGVSNFLARLADAYAKAIERTTESDKPHLLGEALGLVEEGLSISTDHNENYYRPELYRVEGELFVLRARQNPTKTEDYLDKAERSFRQAIELAHSQEGRSLELRAVVSLSRMLVSCRREDEAKKVLLQALGWFAEGHNTADYVQARHVLSSCCSQDFRLELGGNNAFGHT